MYCSMQVKGAKLQYQAQPMSQSGTVSRKEKIPFYNFIQIISCFHSLTPSRQSSKREKASVLFPRIQDFKKVARDYFWLYSRHERNHRAWGAYV